MFSGTSNGFSQIGPHRFWQRGKNKKRNVLLLRGQCNDGIERGASVIALHSMPSFVRIPRFTAGAGRCYTKQTEPTVHRARGAGPGNQSNDSLTDVTDSVNADM